MYPLLSPGDVSLEMTPGVLMGDSKWPVLLPASAIVFTSRKFLMAVLTLLVSQVKSGLKYCVNFA